MTEAAPKPTQPTPRAVTFHQIAGAQQLNNEILIEALNEPGPGGANNYYRISAVRASPPDLCRIPFQQGDPADGVTGATNEALLAIVIDRLRCFQNGPFKCDDNQKALAMAEHSLAWLKRRTEERIKRGVEGKSVK